MLVIPAIDLLGGSVVRLEEGLRERATVYSSEPAHVAEAFLRAGATRLHVVDLDGAFAGEPKNRTALQAICLRVGKKLLVQVGGGVRDEATCEALFAAGVAAVVLGTAAVKDPAFVAAACRRWPGQVIVAVDARDGKVAVEGWAEKTDLSAEDLGRRVVAVGAAAILFTDIARDGLRTGPAVDATARLAAAVAPTPVIASGGVASLDNLTALAEVGVPMCIVGRALYDGAFSLSEAIAHLGSRPSRSR